MKLRKKIWITVILSLLNVAILGGVAVGAINSNVITTAQSRILQPMDAAKLSDVDCILVLGCKVGSDGTPSHMLEDRLKRGVELYKLGAAPKLLMSGDHGRDGYDEVNTMKQYAMDAGVPSEDVFMDHAGFSTYESMYRAKEVFEVKRMIIVTQEYHLYRAIYLANSMGIEAYGVDSDYRTYVGQFARDVREILARVKDSATAVLLPKPTYLGEQIPITGNGDATND